MAGYKQVFEIGSKKVVSYVFSQDAILLLETFINHNILILLVFQLLKPETSIRKQVSFCLHWNTTLGTQKAMAWDYEVQTINFDSWTFQFHEMQR